MGGREFCTLQKSSGHIFKDDVNGFSSSSDICFIVTKRESSFGVVLYVELIATWRF